MMGAVYGRVRVDLRRADDHDLQRAIQDLADMPAGVDIVLEVAPGALVPPFGVQYLRDEGSPGSVTVESGDPATVRRWVLALRGQGPAW